MEVGGRYHTIQVDFKVCSDSTLDNLLLPEELVVLSLFSGTADSLAVSLFSAVAEELVISRDVPGVLGVFAEDPKDAKAPDPSPKADDAPLVGEATVLVVKGAMPLKGVLPLAVPSPPNRFVAEYGRDESGLEFSLLPLVLDVDRESLLEL